VDIVQLVEQLYVAQ